MDTDPPPTCSSWTECTLTIVNSLSCMQLNNVLMHPLYKGRQLHVALRTLYYDTLCTRDTMHVALCILYYDTLCTRDANCYLNVLFHV